MIWKCYIGNFFKKESGVNNLSAIFILNAKDNVGCALEDINSKEYLDLALKGKGIVSKERIPFGFKISIKEIKKGEDIIKYGEVIGKATKNILIGELVHVHNVEGTRGRGDLS
jgi:altronate dehydratase small subunit